MTIRLHLTSVFVDDQAKALDFYTERLGFVLKTDVPAGEFRWLTVVSPDEPAGTELLLEPDQHPAAKAYTEALVADGIPFTGFLYAGLMIDASGAPKVIEFNVRFGDPETKPVMLRLQSDLVELVEAAIDGRLDEVEAQWDARPSLGVVLAARPYPEAPITGDVISGLDDVPASAKVFHAGIGIGLRVAHAVAQC